MKILILFFILLFTTLMASEGEKKIRLYGKLQVNTSNTISPKYIDQNMKVQSFEVYNPWDKRSDTYEGVFIDEFVKQLADPLVTKIILKAIDGYSVSFEKDYWSQERILIANKVNGKYIKISEKGPLRIIFVDYDPKDKKYEKSLPEWMWMIKKIEFQ